ncbi:MAG: winged helix-turn-helix domain-containing protein, partial [Bacteroidaceae bacterium]|nr:winged helix-turn-helix domain-containing protein [Bacteroidaceae bacterium]
MLDGEIVCKILDALANGPQSKNTILIDVLHKTNHFYNFSKYIAPLLEHNYIAMTIKDKPKSSKQKYEITEKGKK